MRAKEPKDERERLGTPTLGNPDTQRRRYLPSPHPVGPPETFAGAGFLTSGLPAPRGLPTCGPFPPGASRQWIVPLSFRIQWRGPCRPFTGLPSPQRSKAPIARTSDSCQEGAVSFARDFSDCLLRIPLAWGSSVRAARTRHSIIDDEDPMPDPCSEHVSHHTRLPVELSHYLLARWYPSTLPSESSADAGQYFNEESCSVPPRLRAPLGLGPLPLRQCLSESSPSLGGLLAVSLRLPRLAYSSVARSVSMRMPAHSMYPTSDAPVG